MVSRCWAMIAALCVSACGGASERDRVGNEAASAGSGSTAVEPAEPEPMPLTDWPWFLGAHGGMVYAEDGVLSFSFDAESTRAQLQTHNHFDLLADRTLVHFVAAANRPAAMLVAFTGISAFENDYWSDLAAGKPWQAVPFEVGVEPRSYDLPLASFSAQGPGTPLPMFDQGTVIWFLIENASGLELELSEISLQ